MKKSKLDHDAPPSPNMIRYAETYVKLSKDRTIFLSEDVTKTVATELSALLLYYDNEDHETEITLYVHSNGGDAYGLSNIYDVMQMISAPVKTICLGKCYSAGAVILAAGTKGQRCALKSSKIMIHGIQFAFPLPGNDITNSKNYYDFIQDNNDNIMKILAHHTGHPLEKLKKDCQEDVWMDSKQALEYGLIDKIIG
jgi:ATP-dependent Clp protease protease subunit